MKNQSEEVSATSINEAHENAVNGFRIAKEAANSGLDWAYKCGEMLIDKKAEVKGDFREPEPEVLRSWSEWVKRNLNFSQRAAQQYMQVFNGRLSIEKKRNAVSFLSFRGALKMLQEPLQKPEGLPNAGPGVDAGNPELGGPPIKLESPCRAREPAAPGSSPAVGGSSVQSEGPYTWSNAADDTTKEVIQDAQRRLGQSNNCDNREDLDVDRVGGEQARIKRPDDAPRIVDEPKGSPRRSAFDIELAHLNRTIEYLKLISIDTLNITTLNKYIVGLRRAADCLAQYSPTQVDIPLPEWIDCELWDYFMILRGKKNKSLTAKGALLLLEKLDGFRAEGQDPDEVLKQTIREGWQGVFSLKEETKNGTKINGGAVGDPDRYAQYEGLIEG